MSETASSRGRSIFGALFGLLLILVAIALAAYGYFSWTRSDGIRGEQQQKLLAAALIGGALVLGIAAAAVFRWKTFLVRIPIILAAILGGSALASMALLTGASYAPQKRTMADIRTVISAIEAYRTDNNAVPPATTIDELIPLLEPTYARTLPRADGWGWPLRYEVIGSGKDATYALGSPGKYGEWEKPRLSLYTNARAVQLSGDLVWRDSEYVQYPEETRSDPP